MVLDTDYQLHFLDFFGSEGTVHYVLPVLDRHFLLYFLEFGIWNLDHLVTCGIPSANTYGIPRNSAKFRGIPGKFYCKNTAEFRMFFNKFRIPPEVKKALPWTP
jgi:hypothetical protein